MDVSKCSVAVPMFSTGLLLSVTQRTISLPQKHEFSAVVFSAQLSQVFEEKNALSLQLRGSGRGGESRQHRSEVLTRRLLLEGELRELQPADKGTVRAGFSGSLVRVRKTSLQRAALTVPRYSYSVSVQCNLPCILASFRSCLQQMLPQERPKKRTSLRAAVTHQNCRSCS